MIKLGGHGPSAQDHLSKGELACLLAFQIAGIVYGIVSWKEFWRGSPLLMVTVFLLGAIAFIGVSGFFLCGYIKDILTTRHRGGK